MIRALALLSFFCMLATNALAKPMPDYSLSPSETARQPNISNNTQPLNSGTTPNGVGDFKNPSAPLLPGGGMPAPSSNFMDGYCDRNFTPAIANDPHYAAIANCLKQQKEQTCAQFQQLPADARQLLDQAISCTNRLLSGENPDTPEAMNAPTNCEQTDGARLQLLKKYWRDANTAYALVFMPDNVLASSSTCMRGGQ